MNIKDASVIVADYIYNLESAASVIDWMGLDDDDPIIVWMDTVHENHLSDEFMTYCEARYILGLDDKEEYDFHLFVQATEKRIARKQRAKDRVRDVYDSDVESGLIGV